jgi:hypothetical protein
MRFAIIHKNDPQMEAEEDRQPPKELVDGMNALMGEYGRSGRFLYGAGLRGGKTRTRLVFRDGRCTTTQGPYRGERELPVAMLTLEVRTREEALGWAERYGKLLGNGEIELGRVIEPWEIGLGPAPKDPPLHYLLIEKADEATEADARTPKQKADLTRLKTEMTKAGVLVKSLRLMPSARAKRLLSRSNDMRVIDGPFTESKELLGGFALMELADMDDAIALCRRYAAVFGGTLEVDARPVDTD